MRTLTGTGAVFAAGLLLFAGDVGSAGRDAGAAPTAPSASAPAAYPRNLIPDGYTGRFRIGAMVLQDEHHGPQLCVAAFTSNPPQCGGLDIPNWSWDGLPSETAAATKWGSYVLIGTVDGTTFRLTEPARAATDDDRGLFRQRLWPGSSIPCPTPAGGWRPVDPARTTHEAFAAAYGMVNAQPDYAGSWLGRLTPPDGTNDPDKVVLVVRFTGDLARHEVEIRAAYGGAICVTAAERSMAELTRIQVDEASEPGTTSSVDPVTGILGIEVFVGTQARQRELDARYGPGVIVLTGLLIPID
ncbi:hypothetical protein [Virgisporangium aurantiacum]|uniref:Uncharacterized protein n=1 Tax=Virgisporangium aurantiacum TaxID=175570 RepID=A0A8J3ZD77_9ACTN|nr:hypothetical protein [Virgisporangium aurantiacum]GIJ61829.1 hypothetical protein Vau01_093450 [Virgisporangium aurantiacum]